MQKEEGKRIAGIHHHRPKELRVGFDPVQNFVVFGKPVQRSLLHGSIATFGVVKEGVLPVDEFGFSHLSMQ